MRCNYFCFTFYGAAELLKKAQMNGHTVEPRVMVQLRREPRGLKARSRSVAYQEEPVLLYACLPICENAAPWMQSNAQSLRQQLVHKTHEFHALLRFKRREDGWYVFSIAEPEWIKQCMTDKHHFLALLGMGQTVADLLESRLGPPPITTARKVSKTR